jgi:hypothetical protein
MATAAAEHRKSSPADMQHPRWPGFDAIWNYVTTYGSNAIYRVNLEGHAELLCVDDECAVLCQATDCAFGGADFDQLFVSNLGAGHISQLDLCTNGQPLWNWGRGSAT